MSIGKLEKVSLREIWKNEAKGFTQWLEENIEVLNESLDLSLASVETESGVGTFAVDLLAEDDNGNVVVIENQLEKTNHDHLGKVLTYLTGLEAKTAIWICSDPRPEHSKVITWLNEATPADISFYLIKVEGVRIEDSSPAPLFSIICAPSEEAKEAGQKKKEFAERHYKRMEFWEGLLVKSRKKTKLHANITPGKWGYIGASAGKPGLALNYIITKDRGDVELYIDCGKGSEEENKKIFDTLYSKKQEIEKDFGGSLDWDRLDGKRASRIKASFTGIGLYDEDKWDALQDKMIDAMIRLEKALKRYIKRLET